MLKYLVHVYAADTCVMRTIFIAERDIAIKVARLYSEKGLAEVVDRRSGMNIVRFKGGKDERAS